MRGRGLKLIYQKDWIEDKSVAPHAGAWIETFVFIADLTRPAVAPHAGAWIETLFGPLKRQGWQRRPPCGGVD